MRLPWFVSSGLSQPFVERRTVEAPRGAEFFPGYVPRGCFFTQRLRAAPQIRRSFDKVEYVVV